VALPQPRRAAALEHFTLLQPHLEDGIPLAHVAAAAGVPLRTAQRWLARYRADGLIGLARQPRRDQGRRRLPQELQLLIEGLALRRPAPTIAAVHRLVAEVARAHGWPQPSYSRVYDIVRSLDPALVTLAHEGAKRYREVFDLIHRRDTAEPNQIWQADHTELDFWVRDPAGKPARP
jgi:putative transposase